MADLEGDGIIIGPAGPRQTTTQGFIQTKHDEINRQGGLGLPSFNAKPNLPEVKELTGQDHRILTALGYSQVNTKV